ncbi:hypothetical protein QEO92_29355 (plasmid) [Neorhizobium petrolearium]|uniref:Uncharacterized protein n=1 Tax=Neorhizobium petrolearium TaxID=515361 RepID=A0ABY8MA70_9HYPH|nr:hypothetical protein [Neorhizobium petrolearium]WGI71446.1 hypothetical protein QEO92_29355 [Neorhizobium petrolearium]
MVDEGQFLLDQPADDRGSLFWRREQSSLRTGAFDDRLALQIADAFPDEDGGDSVGGTLDRIHGGLPNDFREADAPAHRKC